MDVNVGIGSFNQLFERVSSKQQRVDEVVLIRSKELISTAKAIWEDLRLAAESPFTFDMLELAAENGYLVDFISKAPFAHCWMAEELLSVYENLLDKLISRGFIRTNPRSYESSENTAKIINYDLQFPLWLVAALCGYVEHKPNFSGRLDKVVSQLELERKISMGHCDCEVCQRLSR